MDSYSGWVSSSASQLSVLAEFRNLFCYIFKPDLDCLCLTQIFSDPSFISCCYTLLLSMMTENDDKMWYIVAPCFGWQKRRVTRHLCLKAVALEMHNVLSGASLTWQMHFKFCHGGKSWALPLDLLSTNYKILLFIKFLLLLCLIVVKNKRHMLCWDWRQWRILHSASESWKLLSPGLGSREKKYFISESWWGLRSAIWRAADSVKGKQPHAASVLCGTCKIRYIFRGNDERSYLHGLARPPYLFPGLSYCLCYFCKRFLSF